MLSLLTILMFSLLRYLFESFPHLIALLMFLLSRCRSSLCILDNSQICYFSVTITSEMTNDEERMLAEAHGFGTSGAC